MATTAQAVEAFRLWLQRILSDGFGSDAVYRGYPDNVHAPRPTGRPYLTIYELAQGRLGSEPDVITTDTPGTEDPALVVQSLSQGRELTMRVLIFAAEPYAIADEIETMMGDAALAFEFLHAQNVAVIDVVSGPVDVSEALDTTWERVLQLDMRLRYAYDSTRETPYIATVDPLDVSDVVEEPAP